MDQIQTPLRYIRTELFGLTQEQLAAALNISQSGLSKAERNNEMVPGGLQLRIRQLARERGIEWNDSLFFEVPTEAA